MYLVGQSIWAELVILCVVVGVISYLVPPFLALIHQLDCSVIKMILLLQRVSNTMLIYQVLAFGARSVLDLTTQT